MKPAEEMRLRCWGVVIVRKNRVRENVDGYNFPDTLVVRVGVDELGANRIRWDRNTKGRFVSIFGLETRPFARVVRDVPNKNEKIAASGALFSRGRVGRNETKRPPFTGDRTLARTVQQDAGTSVALVFIAGETSSRWKPPRSARAA